MKLKKCNKQSQKQNTTVKNIIATNLENLEKDINFYQTANQKITSTFEFLNSKIDVPTKPKSNK